MENKRFPWFTQSGLRVFVDLALLLCFVFMAISGFQLEEAFEESEPIFGLREGIWCEIHVFLFYAIAV